MAATYSEPMLGPSMALEELDEILDRIAATSSFSSANLKERVKAKYMGLQTAVAASQYTPATVNQSRINLHPTPPIQPDFGFECFDGGIDAGGGGAAVFGFIFTSWVVG